MQRVALLTVALCLVVLAVVLPAHSMNPYAMPPQCAPKPCYVTKLVPCVKTELVAEVQPCTAVVPVKKIAYTCRRVLVKYTPVGRAKGMDPCTRCCPTPFCRVVTQKVPYTYCEPKSVPWYRVVYKKVCRTVWLPQTFRVDAYPMCR